MKIILGTAQFGQRYGISNTSKVSKKEIKKILKISEINNVLSIDTSSNYGKCEEILGEIGIKKFKIYSKFDFFPEGKKNVLKHVEKKIFLSLSKLKKDFFEGVYIHSFKNFLRKRPFEIIESLLNLKARGIIKKIGFSIYFPEEYKYLKAIYKPDLIQVPLNLFDQRFLRKGIIKQILNDKIELNIRSIFLQGLLLMKKKERPKKFKKWSFEWKMWDEWLSIQNLTPLEACIKYIYSIKKKSNIIVGVNDSLQLKEILKIKNEKKNKLNKFKGFEINKLINPTQW